MDVQGIGLDRISTEGTQTRDGIRLPAVEEYADLIRSGAEMEPATVFDDGKTLHLAAGHHRCEAYRRAGREQMPCIVKQGGKWDAIEYGLKDNLQHRGERLTTADKRHNIRLVLREQPKWGDEKIAELCGVSPKTVAKYRHEMEATLEIPELSSRIGRDGRIRDTFNLGRKPSAVAAQAQERTVADDRAPDPFLDLKSGIGAVGATGAKQATQAATRPDSEHCSCGGQWMSSGHGFRFCELCNAVHPADPEPDDDPSKAPEGSPSQGSP